MKFQIPINKNITLNQLNRRALFEGIEIEIDNGKAYAIMEVIKK